MKSDRNLTVKQIKEKYFADTQTKEDCQRKHLVMLAENEEQKRNDGTYTNASIVFKKNSIDRIKKYIGNRTAEERTMNEYHVFIDSMEKSLAMLSC